MLVTVAEMPEFARCADRLMSESERKEVIDYLAAYPKSGDLLQGTGGIRKLRWARGGKGKSGGVRAIYYFHDRRIPLDLLTVFGKVEKESLSKADRTQLAELAGVLK